jgi:hypothetical protein
MGGKKIDRKKQSLLSRASKRQETIKKLSHKPVIKKVDIEAIKESFRKGINTASKHTENPVLEKPSEIVSTDVSPKKTRKVKKEE